MADARRIYTETFQTLSPVFFLFSEMPLRLKNCLLITRPSLWGCIKQCIASPVRLSVRPSRASDFLEAGKQ